MKDANPYSPPESPTTQAKSAYKLYPVLFAVTLLIGAELGLIFVLPVIKVEAFRFLTFAYAVILLPLALIILSAKNSLNSVSGGVVCVCVLLAMLVNWTIIKVISHIG